MGTDPDARSIEPTDDAATLLWDCFNVAPGTSVYLLDDQGVFLYCNAEFARLMGDPVGRTEPIIGKQVRDLVCEDLAMECESRRAMVATSGAPVLARLIWQGRQLQLWTTQIPPESPGERSTFLTIVRPVEGTLIKQAPPVDLLESKYVSLGPLDALTPAELEVLALIGQGLSAKEIGDVLGRSSRTVEGHRASIGHKLNVNDRVTLSHIAQRAGLTLRDARRDRL